MTRSVNHQMLTELQITQYTVYIAEHSLILTKNTKIQLISYVPQSNWWVHKGLTDRGLAALLLKKPKYIPPPMSGGYCYTFLRVNFARCLHFPIISVLEFKVVKGFANAIMVFSVRHRSQWVEPP